MGADSVVEHLQAPGESRVTKSKRVCRILSRGLLLRAEHLSKLQLHAEQRARLLQAIASAEQELTLCNFLTLRREVMSAVKVRRQEAI